ncbi:hypothetical protein I302_106621 [Kwoniella bestiolae CBS 10118]|uniref:Uncharacterized protein n=1 Tax=Kwoniella bestiolae CBS 10118 TaxID=1296100 RepID=A0A1B9G0W5_9TREE|nr:hypothetical protein I302_06117 [Kwoniella bestiolae CBS 10118]OCF24656.1 hypothetical protein I302_06117 [Kwoniella bestiolae CBS 10118]
MTQLHNENSLSTDRDDDPNTLVLANITIDLSPKDTKDTTGSSECESNLNYPQSFLQSMVQVLKRLSVESEAEGHTNDDLMRTILSSGLGHSEDESEDPVARASKDTKDTTGSPNSESNSNDPQRFLQSMAQGFKSLVADSEEEGDMDDDLMRRILSRAFGHSEDESRDIVARARLGIESTLANEDDDLKTIVFCAAPIDSPTDDLSKFEQVVVDIRDMDKGKCIHALCILDSIISRRIKGYYSSLQSKHSGDGADERSDTDTGSGTSDLSNQPTVLYTRTYGPVLARKKTGVRLKGSVAVENQGGQTDLIIGSRG